MHVTNTSRIGGLLAAATVALASPGLALAGTTSAPGYSCVPGFYNTTIFHDDFGTGNPSTTSTLSYICPVILGDIPNAFAAIQSAGFQYVDNSSAYYFTCYMFLTTGIGSQYWGRTKYTCSNYGGCNNANDGGGTVWKGTNQLAWFGSDLPAGGAFAHFFNDAAGFRCEVPRASSQTVSGMSWIRSSWIQW